MQDSARSSLRANEAVHNALIRGAVALYCFGVVALAVLWWQETTVRAWAAERALDPTELLRLARLAPLMACVAGVVMMTISVWQTVVLRYNFSTVSPAAARARAYGFVPLAVALFALAAYLAKL